MPDWFAGASSDATWGAQMTRYAVPPSRAVTAFLLVVSIAASCPAHSQTWNLYDGDSSVDISYVSGGLDASPNIGVGFDNSTNAYDFVMDTGSVGVLVSADHFTPAPDAKFLGFGQQIYTSSGVVDNGEWWTAKQNIYSDGVLVATVEVPVLRVTSVSCLPTASNCTADQDPKNIGIIGIGFARESPTDADPATHGPDYNAFLNLTSVQLTTGGPLQPLPADWHSGYVVTATGVSLGLTADNTANAGFVKLLPAPLYSTPTHQEWMPTPMDITVNGTTGPGNLLIDTGVTDAYLVPPPGATFGPLFVCPLTVPPPRCAPDGTSIAVLVPGQGGGQAMAYNFQLGPGITPPSPMEPDDVIIALTGTSFNTSRHVLSGLDYIYDAENGFVGYHWLNTAGATGSVNIIVALQGPFAAPDHFFEDLPIYMFGPTTLGSRGVGEFAGSIVGNSALTIDGPGNVILSGISSYTAPTTVAGGTLSVNGIIVSPVTVQKGGTLGGTGLIGNDVTVLPGGIYAPGNSIGTQFIAGALTFARSGIFEIEVNAAGENDRVVVTGPVDLTGAVLRLMIQRGVLRLEHELSDRRQ